MTRYFLTSCFACLLLLGTGMKVAAQNIPGAAESDVQRIVAVVNDDVISAYDLNLRMSLIVAATGGVSSEEEYLNLRDSVLDSMIDELLQIQEARTFDVEISQQEIDQAIGTLARNNNMDREQFERYLASIGSDIGTLLPQITSSIAWQRLIQGRFSAQVQVSDAEIQAVIDRLQANAGEAEYQVSEIFLTPDNASERDEAAERAARLAEQLRGNVPFESLARQFSRSASAATGGDMGWVQASQVPEPLAETLSGMSVGEISDPIEAEGGFYIIRLSDRRRVLAADPRDVELNLKQISFELAPDATPQERQSLMDRVSTVTAGRNSCTDTAGVATDLGSQSYGEVGTVKLRDLPQELQTRVESLDIGEASEPFVNNGQMLVLAVCERTEPQVEPPSPAVIEDNLTNQRLSMMSQRYLRDLRQDAIIDYR